MFWKKAKLVYVRSGAPALTFGQGSPLLPHASEGERKSGAGYPRLLRRLRNALDRRENVGVAEKYLYSYVRKKNARRSLRVKNQVHG